jgi:hypothetical protein
MFPKSHTHQRCGTLRKKSFSVRGYVEIHIQRPFFFTIKKTYKNYCIENPKGDHIFYYFLYT